MTDGASRSAEVIAEPPPQPQAEPPLLDTIRVKAGGPRGINKPAILGAAGGGVALVLLLASGAFTGDPTRKPGETKPMMSDPARPEMAKGAIRDLPADYTQVPAAPPALAPDTPIGPPQLGPPLPGDVAAFAQQAPEPRTYTRANPEEWTTPHAYTPVAQADPRDVEMKEAERSALFFTLRDQPAPGVAPLSQQHVANQSPPSGLTAVAPDRPTTPRADATTDRALFPGAIIPASLMTELNSESPGPVIAQVTQSIYDSASGHTLLIPQGAKLIGDYKSSSRYGQSRVAIQWSRLIMPDGAERALDEAAVSSSGAAGISGDVDSHWGDVFGAAALGTLINVGVATTEDPQITFSGISPVSRDPVDQAIQDGVQRTASTVTNRVVDRGLAIPPTIRVQAGTRISVIVTRRSTF